MIGVRLVVIACVTIAGASVASAQGEPPIFPPPQVAPVAPASAPASATPPATPPAPVPVTSSSAPQGKLDRALAEQQCAAKDPRCDWFATLGGLERQSVRRALVARGYQLEPVPWGKTVGKIRVYNEEVFAEKNRLLRFFNHFHVTTKEQVIRDEVVLRPGELWDQDQIEETARGLRDPLFSSVIAVVPVKAAEPGKVDMLVVTRDIWSLRLNTQYTFQQGSLTNLSTSLSENNFLGRRNVLAAALTMDQGSIAAGPLFIDKNFLGEHLDLRARVNTILERDALLHDGHKFITEGSSSTVTLSKSLWTLASKWGGGGTFTHRFAIDRRFVGTGLRGVRCPPGEDCVTRFDPATTPADEILPWVYSMRRWGVNGYAVRQFGTRVKQQLTLGYSVDSQRPQLLGSFPGTDAQREPFRRAVLPRSELTSVPYVSYSVFTPRYKTRRNVGTYDLAEDLRLGPDAEVTFGVGLTLLGSDVNFMRGNVGGGWTFPWCRDGSIRVSAAYAGRRQDGEQIDNGANLSMRVVTPSFGPGRIVAESTLGTRWNDTTTQFLTIGSDNGLRGFGINQFFGSRVFGTQIEGRSIPRALWVMRVGAIAFYEVGGAADTLSTLGLHHDVGIGLRALFPQTSRELFRFDLAFPLDGAAAGHPKFSAGFQQEF